jgi:DNA-binding transcriptional ArsR family regulator
VSAYLRICLNSPVTDPSLALRALTHPGRRRALSAVIAAERSSSSLAEECGWSKPAASQNLKVLRAAGLVEVRVDGNRRLYRARQQGVAQLRGVLDELWADRLSTLEDEIRAPR